MGLLKPTPPPYDPIEWARMPFSKRARMVCQAWALQGYGAPVGAYLLYLAKVAFYIGMWSFFCGFSPGLGGLERIADWWLEPVAFQKAILWSMLFEVLGLGCGSGPLTGRYLPPLGGFLYFLRPGTTKLSLLPRIPLIGGSQRTLFDVILYAALLAALGRLLVSPEITIELLIPVLVILPVLGLADKTIFLAARGEHYWTTAVCFLLAGQWLAGAKAVQLALWFWAGFSKLNHHFPSVVGVMNSNSPFTRFDWLRKLMYRSYPNDLRPSTLAAWMGHVGTGIEMAIPIILALAPGGWPLMLGMILMLGLHIYITSNVPMGVPIEWNFLVVYAAFALFYAHPEVTLLDLQRTPLLAVFLGIMLIALPLIGNIYPRLISFLLAMRYYAGNWACSVWMFKGESHRKLEKLPMSAPWVYDQLDRFYPPAVGRGIVSKVMGFRLMHLHGRALPILIPKAVDRLEDYEYLDGEVVAGLVLGYNFGDGHLHDESLLRIVSQRCGFEAGELRCIMIESQPMGKHTMNYRIHDGKTGLIEEGYLDVRLLRKNQPWAAGPGSA